MFWLIYFFIMVALLVRVLKDPAAVLTLVPNLFGLEQWVQASHGFFLAHSSFTNIVAGCFVLLAVAVHLSKGRLHGTWVRGVTGPLVVLFVYAFLSTFWAPPAAASGARFIEAFPYLVTLVLLVSLTVQEPRDLGVALRSMMMFGTVLAIALLVFVEWEGRRVLFGVDSRGEFIAGNPLAVGTLGGTLVLLGVLYRSERSRLLGHVLRGAVVLLGLALVVRSGSRGQLMGALAVGGIFWFVAHSSRQLFKPLIGLSMLALLLTLTSVVKDLFWAGDARFAADRVEGDYAGRLDAAVILLERWLESPFSTFFGLGSSASYDPRILGGYPHVVPAEVLGELGLVGFGIYCWVVLAALTAALRAFRAVQGDVLLRANVVCFIALWVYALLLTTKQGSMLLSHEFFLYSLLLGRIAWLMAKHSGSDVAIPHSRAGSVVQGDGIVPVPLLGNVQRIPLRDKRRS